MTYVVAAFYKFVHLPDFAQWQERLLSCCLEQGIKGTILLAKEGINGTIAGSRPAIDTVLRELRGDPRLTDLEPKESYTDAPPFERLKVRLKREIVTLGLPEVDPSDRSGIYVSPQEWNTIISDPAVVVVDTRNEYEVAIGTFRGANNPQIRSFRQFPEYVRTQLDPSKTPKVAMFCTGGIRCEKASAFMLSQGFEQVYQLQGGILKYLEEVPADESLWQGECFVFDQRTAVKHGVMDGSYESCRGCGRPVSDADKASPKYELGVSCPQCFDTLTEEQKRGHQERQRQLERAK